MLFDEAKLEKIRNGDIIANLEKYNKLAMMGNKESYSILGYLYEFGGKNCIPNPSKAEFFYRKSYEEFKDIDSQLAIARVSLHLKQDFLGAYNIYSSLKSHEIPIVHLSLGRIYENEKLVDIHNLEKAKYHYKKSYSLGNLYGGLFYTRLLFQPESESSLSAGLFAFFKHQFLRFLILLYSIFNESNNKIKVA